MVDIPQLPTMRDPVAQGTFAALLKAQRGDCECEPCQILRTVADRMAEGFKKSG